MVTGNWWHRVSAARPARRRRRPAPRRSRQPLAAQVARRHRLADERARSPIRSAALPPHDHRNTHAFPTTEPAGTAPQPEPLINAIPLPPAIAPDSAHLALTALRVAGRLVPLLLLALATRIDTHDATRVLGDQSAHALAAWLEAWGRRPVVQFFRASGDHIFDATILQYLLADALTAALASDTTLAHEAARLLRPAEAHS
ncbi:hypothetical protein [Roseiflexus castenholzii]|uniref:Uncharacterized protein n=1 Tax=Roseiflexus castenholzii (strain DSM 13941 / HLO8) TaxID=383372 RepID=A7NLG2_ROSCS|nr:hypothetical protein [Roseiflexus castenholzii]ABU58345.1 hypothetical protein Rcas_2262 [Roseiflexus castenholzii DSM 13941]